MLAAMLEIALEDSAGLSRGGSRFQLLKLQEREPTRDKPVASGKGSRYCSGERESPRDKPAESFSSFLQRPSY